MSTVVVWPAVTATPVLTGLNCTVGSAWSGLSWAAWHACIDAPQSTRQAESAALAGAA
jgi:hypothetical protein